MHSGENDNHVQSQNSLSKNTSIMIIDDEEDILNLFNDLLQQQGYSVTTYNNSILALQEIEKNHWNTLWFLQILECREYRDWN